MRRKLPALLPPRPAAIIGLGLVLAVVATPSKALAQGTFIRGDCNQDQRFDIADALSVLNYLFLGGADPRCLAACDVDGTRNLVITDAIFALSFLFLGGPPPPEPFPVEDADPVPGGLSCENGRLPVVELGVAPPRLRFFRLGEERQVRVRGALADGAVFDVTAAPTIAYEVEPASLASASPSGRIRALSVGQGILRVRFRRLVEETAIEVLPGADGAPRIEILHPSDGAVVGAAEVAVEGRSDDPRARIEVGGAAVAAGPDAAGFFRHSAPLALGANVIDISASNGAGVSMYRLRVTRIDASLPGALAPDGLPFPSLPAPLVSAPDSQPPAIAIRSPAPAAVLASSRVLVRGSVEPADAEVAVNGVSARAGEDGSFEASIELAVGARTIEAAARDAAGNVASARVDVTIDGAAPELVLQEPAPAAGSLAELPEGFAWASASPVRVRGAASQAGMTVLVNGAPALVAGTAFEAQVALLPGLNRVLAVGSAPAGPDGAPPKRAAAMSRIFLDQRPPAIRIFNPEPTATPAGALLIAGEIEDDSTAIAGLRALSLRANGSPVPLRAGRFAFEAALPQGPSTIELVARDGAGNESRRTLAVASHPVLDRHLLYSRGAGQRVAPLASAAERLEVAARDGSNRPLAAAPVVFEVLAGDGVLDGGRRRVAAATDAAGIAAVGFSAGRAAGQTIVLASLLERPAAAVAFSVETTTLPGAPLLAPRWGRWERGPAGRIAPRPLGARVLDAFGNPVSDFEVTFRVVSGGALLDNIEREKRVRSGADGAAVTAVLCDRADGLSQVEAVIPNAAPIRFTVESLTSGAALDTAVRGLVADGAGRPLEGAIVRLRGAGGLEAPSDRRGEFAIAGAPSGWAVIEIEPPDPSLESTTIEVFAVSGRLNVVPEPIALPSSEGAARLAVSPRSGGRLSLPGLGSWSLDFAAGSATFPDGLKSGWVTAAPAPLRQFPAAIPDDSAVHAAAWILPQGLRFDPPARLVAPAMGEAAGSQPPLWARTLSSGEFFAGARGRVLEGGLEIESAAPAGGIREGGLVFFAVPGPPGGERASVEGSIDAALLLGDSDYQHPASRSVAIGVLPHSGEWTLEAVDLELRGRGGVAFALRRRYESRHHVRGSLGWGWEHEYADRRLVQLPGGNILRADGRCRLDEFLFHAPSGRHLPPPGIFNALWRRADGVWIERSPDGLRHEYHALDGGPLAGRLATIADPNGNRVRIVRGGDGRIDHVLDALSRRIAYEWSPLGLIAAVADAGGRTVRFAYDAHDRLVSVTGPAVAETPNRNDFPGGKTTRYAYSAAADPRLSNNIVAVYSPNESGPDGVPWLANVYGEDPGSETFDRVVVQRWGGQNASGVDAGGSYSFSYAFFGDAAGAAGDPEAEIGRLEVVDPCGTRRQMAWNGMGLVILERVWTRPDLGPQDPTRQHPEPGVDPTAIDERFRYDGDGLLLEHTRPGGGRIVYEYDRGSPLRAARSRAWREVLHPPPGDAAAPLARMTLREPIFGRVVRESEWHPADQSPPAVTRTLIDYQEGASLFDLADESGSDPQDIAGALERTGTALSLGDQNGDGSAALRGGNPIVVLHPDATLPDGAIQPARELWRWNRFGQAVEHVDAGGHRHTFAYWPESDPEGDGVPNLFAGVDAVTGGYLRETIVDAGPAPGAGAPPPVRRRAAYRYDRHGHLAEITDGRGLATALLHNALGQLVELRAPEPLRFRRWYYYDGDDRLVRAEVENLTATLDGFIVAIPEHPWIAARWERDLLGRVVTEHRELSADAGQAAEAGTSYRYDACGRLAEALHPAGDAESWSYDERGHLLAHTARGGGGFPDLITAFRHDLDGRLVRQIGPEDIDGDGEEESRSWVFDGFGRLVAEVDELGGVRRLELDDAGRVIEEAFLGSAGGISPVGRSGAANVLLARTRYGYDERGRRARVLRSRFGVGGPSEGAAAEEVFTLDANGRTAAVRDAMLAVRRFDHDGAGRLIRSVDADGNETRRDYDGNGNCVRTIERRRSSAASPGGERIVTEHATVRVFDALNRQVAEVGPSGATRRWVYDSRGLLITHSDAAGTPSAAATDVLLSTVLPLLAPEQRERSNSHGNRVLIEYDLLGRPSSVAYEMREGGQGQRDLDLGNSFNADARVSIQYRWDASGRLVSFDNDRGQTTGLVRDPQGRVIRIDGPGPQRIAFHRDKAGRPRRIVDRAGNDIEQSFDALGRLTRRTVVRARGAGGEGIDIEGTTLQRFEWDGLSRLTAAYDNNSPDDPEDDVLAVRRYDSLGRLVVESVAGAPVAIERDAAGRAVAYRYPGGRRIEHVRDALGRVVAIKDDASVFAELVHLGGDRVLSRRLGNGVEAGYLEASDDGSFRAGGLGPDGEVLRQRWRDAAGADLLDFEYGYDRERRRSFVRRLHAPSPRGDALQYDSIGRLVLFMPDLRDPRTPPINPAEFTQYFHDGNGNVRLSIVDFVNTPYDVDVRDVITRVGARAIGSDAAGAIVRDGSIEYRYDFLGRVARVLRAGASVAAYAYDAAAAADPEPRGPAGRLALRRVATPGAGDGAGRHDYAFLGERPVEERGDNAALLREWVHEPDGSPLAAIAFDAAGRLRASFLLRDGAGHVVGLTDESGKLAETFRYGLFGAPVFLNAFATTVPASPSGNLALYGGHLYDPSSALYTIAGRALSPALGRHLAPRHPDLAPLRLPLPDGGHAGAAAFVACGALPPSPIAAAGLPSLRAGILEAPPALGVHPTVFAGNDPVNRTPPAGIEQ
jgi:YD repeat-containing protein